ncbi:MAG: hypothetical protein H7Y18_09575 [Clostridiaceae bacterium]|nr:hypothetical protein [Clostridiaceae bacterium]
MLACEMCNYYKRVNVEARTNNACVCEITGFQFKKDIEEYEMEYPCYENKFNMEQLNIITPKKTVASHVILKDQWKFEYKRKHFKPFINRHNIENLNFK